MSNLLLEVFSKTETMCPSCKRTEGYLRSRGVDFTVHGIEENASRLADFITENNIQQAPLVRLVDSENGEIVKFFSGFNVPALNDVIEDLRMSERGELVTVGASERGEDIWDF